MTELKDLKVGDEVTLTVKGVVSYQDEYVISVEFHENFNDIDFDEDLIKSGAVTIKRAPRPLPTEPGVYVPANNAKFPQASWLYKLQEAGRWSCMSAGKILEDSEALEQAERAQRTLGGLVRLVPEQ